MATVINSSTTGLIVTPDATGQLTISANGVTALTANTAGNINFAKQPTIGGVEWPAFSAYKSSAQSLSSATNTKITFDTEEFDTNNNFASSTFTPTVAGYYQITGAINNSTGTQTVAMIFKNGSVFKTGTNNSSYTAIVTALVYFNGTTDYVDFYGYFASGTTTGSGNSQTYFQGVLVRAA